MRCLLLSKVWLKWNNSVVMILISLVGVMRYLDTNVVLFVDISHTLKVLVCLHYCTP